MDVQHADSRGTKRVKSVTKTYSMRIEYYRCTLRAIKGKGLIEVVAWSEKAFIVGAVCDVDMW